MKVKNQSFVSLLVPYVIPKGMRIILFSLIYSRGQGKEHLMKRLIMTRSMNNSLRLRTAVVILLIVITVGVKWGYAQTLSDLPDSVRTLMSDRSIKVAVIESVEQSESLSRLETNQNLYNIVFINQGQLSKRISTILRKWLENGGVIWAVDRAYGATWRSKDLFGGLITGADKEWEEPHQVQVVVHRRKILPYESNHPIAKGVASLFAGYDHTLMSKSRDPREADAALTVFDREVEVSAEPLLKAEKMGVPVIGHRCSRAPTGMEGCGDSKKDR